jgi:HrpA-like RNA helicase
MFCGILHNKIAFAVSNQGFSHIVIDEVHERTLESDLLLIAIRDILVRRPTLRVIIMSATLDSRRFADYFAEYKAAHLSCTTLEVPSAGHKVATLFLEDAIQLTCKHCI